MGPNECKYCGCGEIRSETDSAIHFKCFSSYWHDGDEWNIATNCAAKCAVQLVELRERIQQADHDIEFVKAREANAVTALKSRLRTLNERIQRAVEMLKGQDRIIMVLDDDDEDVVSATGVDQAIEILEGV